MAGATPPPEKSESSTFGGPSSLPGLWDVHVHFEWPRLTALTVAEQVVQNYHNAVRGLTEAGVTGIRSAGVAHFSDVALKRAFDSGQHLGPRIFAAGHILTTTAGHAVTNPFTKVCDGPDSFVRAVREQIQNGGGPHQAADDRRHLGPGLGPPSLHFSDGGGTGGCLCHIPPARVQGHGPCRQP